MGDSLIELPSAGQPKTKIDVGKDVVRLDGQCLLVLRNGHINLPAAGQATAEVVVGCSVVRLEFNRPPEMGNGPVKLPTARPGLGRSTSE